MRQSPRPRDVIRWYHKSTRQRRRIGTPSVEGGGGGGDMHVDGSRPVYLFKSESKGIRGGLRIKTTPSHRPNQRLVITSATNVPHTHSSTRGPLGREDKRHNQHVASLEWTVMECHWAMQLSPWSSLDRVGRGRDQRSRQGVFV